MDDRSPDLDKAPEKEEAFSMPVVESNALDFGGAERDLAAFNHRGYGLNRELPKDVAPQDVRPAYTGAREEPALQEDSRAARWAAAAKESQ